MTFDLAALAGLFAAALLAATPLPGASEAVLIALLAAGGHDPVLLVAVAGAGNTLGSIVNWVCGRFLLRFRDRCWFPVSATQLERAAALFGRWRMPLLLFAWVPVFGDALTVVAGLLRVRLVPFVLVVGIGKTLRYAAVALAALGLLPA